MIVDFIPASTVDYPGNLAATAFVGGCSFHCPYCHNSALLTQSGTANAQKQFFKFLKKRQHLLDGVVISGGEPTLWDGLMTFAGELKHLGFKVKLDTNGTSPIVVNELLEHSLIDYVAMDIKAPLDKYDLFTGDATNAVVHVQNTIKALLNSSVPYEFRTTVHPRIHALTDFSEIAQLLHGAKRYAIQGYHPSPHVLDPVFCGTSPCSLEFLQEIKQLLEDQFDELIVRP